MTKEKDLITSDRLSRPEDRRPEDEMRLVAEVAQPSDGELEAFRCREGLHEAT